MEETNLQEDEGGSPPAPPPKPAKKLSKTPAKVMTAEEGRLYFQEQRERKLVKDRVKAERQKKFHTSVHNIYQSWPIKICTYVSFFLINTLPIGAIILGIIYIKKEDCPADHIAVAMILVGIFGTLTAISHLYASWKEKRAKKLETAKRESATGESLTNPDGEIEAQAPPKSSFTEQFKNHRLEACTAIIFKITEFCLWIYACVIVFRLFSDVQYEKTENSNEFYCNKVLYRYAFWSLASSFIFFGLWLGMACCLGCFGSWYIDRSVPKDAKIETP